MFDNVLVGVDGRQGGRDAIALAMALSAPAARMTLVHVDDTEITDGPDRTGDSRKMLSDERARTAVDASILAVPGSSVGEALHQLAARRQYDLLVVGACHLSAIGRRVAPDHTSQSLKDARCAVAVAPQAYAGVSGISRVGDGWDGSPEAAQALHAARTIATRTGATIEPLVVLPVQSRPYGQPIQHRWSDVAEQLTAEDRARLDGMGDIEGQVGYGSPGKQLACFSEGLDLLIVGSRNSGLAGRLLTGSTSHYLTRHARCALLVFPRATGVGASD
jgi:nucleotide-binding universal stress UspA family protein